MLRATLTGALLAGTAFAQVSSPLAIAQGLLNFVSDDCRNTIYSLVNSSSPQYQCLQVDYLLPAITTNGSIIPPVDNYLHQICSSAPCNSTVLNATASAINSGCSAELQQFGVSSDLVDQVIGYYGLARDVVCLKNENQEVLANATIPLNSTLFNTTSSNVTAPSLNGTTNSTSSSGTFCLTEFALNVTGYLGVNLTNSYVDTLALGGNYSALRALEAIPPTALCSDCIFAAVNLINEEIPQFGQIVVNSSTNTTINSYLDNTCSVQGYNATGNGTLPDGIFEGGVNSTSSLNTTSSATPASASSVAVGVSSGAASVASAATATAAGAATAVGSGVSAATSGVAQLAGRMAEKRRWVGQQ